MHHVSFLQAKYIGAVRLQMAQNEILWIHVSLSGIVIIMTISQILMLTSQLTGIYFKK